MRSTNMCHSLAETPAARGCPQPPRARGAGFGYPGQVTDALSYHPEAPGTTAQALPGTFLALEGGDGGGKSTQARLLAQRLEAAGADVVLTREPGGTALGERIRELLLDPAHGEMDARAEALLYAAARAAHARQTIRPALALGAVVICDRYLDSSAAYQGAGRGLGEQTITDLSRWATRELLPDLTLFLQVPDDDARARLAARGAAPDRLEAEPDAFRSRTAAAFRALAARGGSRQAVDGRGEVAEVAARIDAVIGEHLPRLGALLTDGTAPEARA